MQYYKASKQIEHQENRQKGGTMSKSRGKKKTNQNNKKNLRFMKEREDIRKLMEKQDKKKKKG